MRDVAIGVVAGIAVAVFAWWAVFSISAVVSDASGTLREPQYPILPRLLLVLTAAVTTGVLLVSGAAAATAAVVSVLFVSYSLLLAAGIAPDVLGSTIAGWNVTTPPGYALATGGPAGVIRDLLVAISAGGTHLALLLLAGIWASIALRSVAAARHEGIPWASASRTPPGWIALVVGGAIAVAGFWMLPMIGRALTLMLVEGREAFSVLPSLVALALAVLTCWPMLRWPRMAHGAALAALVVVAISAVLADPAPSGIAPRPGDWWSFSVVDLLRVTTAAAYAPATLILASAWVIIASMDLLQGRRPAKSPRYAAPSAAA